MILEWGPLPTYGEALKVPGGFSIMLDSETLDPFVIREHVTHEWAHVMSWRSKEHHGDSWGKAYAACYRAVEGVR